MLDGRELEASQVEYKPFGKPPLQREPFSLFFGPLFLGPLVFFFFCFFLALQRLARLKCNLEPNCKHI